MIEDKGPAQQEVPQEVPPKEPAKEPKKKPKKEKPAACEKCGKKLSAKAWYYRNGKYFCNKRCWKAQEAEKKAKEEKEKPNA